jgi:hypothetical protein
MQASGAAIAKQPLKTKVAHKQLFVHVFGDLSLIKVHRNETLTSARIGL